MKIVRIEYRLREWGNWITYCIHYGLGYPGRSTIVAAKEGSRSTAPSYPKDNPDAEEINRLVLHLGRIHPDWSALVKYEYTEPGSRLNKIKKLGIKRFTYNSTLEKAISWIEGALMQSQRE